MKSTDLRAKARAIFGPADAEPMPNQPNGAKALQQRANARPIPTYKVGGVVKKNDGGLLKKPVRGRSVTIPLEEERVKKLKKPANAPKMVDFEPRQPKTGSAPANAPKPQEMKRGPEADDVLITTRRGQQMLDAQKRREMEMEAERRKKQAAADKLLGNRMKNGGKAGCYAEGGKPLKFDPKKEKPFKFEPKKEKPFKFEPKPEKPFKFTGKKDGGKVQTSADTAKKLATEMGGMKKGGKAKDGLAVMIAIGKVKKPVKKAVGGAGKMRKGMMKG